MGLVSQCSLQKAAAETSEAPAAAADWNLAKLVLFKVHKLGSEKKKKKAFAYISKRPTMFSFFFAPKPVKFMGWS